MNNFRESLIVISALFIALAIFFTKCSDPRIQEKITKETIDLNRINNEESLYKNEIVIKNDIGNSKTLYQKPKQMLDKIDHDIENKLNRLIKERDEALEIISTLKSANRKFKVENSRLNEELKTVSDCDEYKSLLNNKLETLTLELSNEKKLNSDSEKKIKNLTTERDEAIRISLALKDENSELRLEIDNNSHNMKQTQQIIEDQKREIYLLNSEIAHLKDSMKKSLKDYKDLSNQLEDEQQRYIELESKLAQYNSKLSTEESMLSNKDSKIEDLIKQRNTIKSELLELKQNYENLKIEDSQEIKLLQDQIKSLKTEISKLEEISNDKSKELEMLQSKKSSLTQKLISFKESRTKSEEQIATTAAALLAAQQLNSKKQKKIQQLLKERDEAIELTLKMKKDHDENRTKLLKLDKKNKELMEKLVVCNKNLESSSSTLESTKKLLINKDSDIKELTKQRDKAINEINTLQERIESVKAKFLHTENLLSQKVQKVKQTSDSKLEKNKKAVLDKISTYLKLSKIEFKTNSAVLTKKSTKVLDKVADIMIKHKDYHFKINGHTDSKGDERLNLRLSTQRAKSVKDYLVLKGVEESILTYKGFGSSKPIADNKTVKGRLANRRVVFEIED